MTEYESKVNNLLNENDHFIESFCFKLEQFRTNKMQNSRFKNVKGKILFINNKEYKVNSSGCFDKNQAYKELYMLLFCIVKQNAKEISSNDKNPNSSSQSSESQPEFQSESSDQSKKKRTNQSR